MKICYLDESGSGSEPILVVAGIVVDSQRMHVTKEHWQDLLDHLSKITGRMLDELHTKDFYPGNGVFRRLSGSQRVEYISAIIRWFCDRKHAFVYSAVEKRLFKEMSNEGGTAQKVSSEWLAASFHCVLSVQRAHSSHEKTKGHTILIFDRHLTEQERLAELVISPPSWSDGYYNRAKKQKSLDLIVDAPYFADSKHVPLLQVADFLAYFLRRHAEIVGGAVPARYEEERERIGGWIKDLSSRCIGINHIYPARSRSEGADFFYEICPESLRKLEWLGTTVRSKENANPTGVEIRLQP